MELIQTIASIAAAIGIFIAVVQLLYSYRHSITRFEDEMSREYRDIIRPIPTKFLLGKEITDEEFNEIIDRIFSYLDLSNEEIFLRKKGRVSKRTWFYWREGIISNMRKPAFIKAWKMIEESNLNKKDEDKIYTELSRLLASEDKEIDPKKWRNSK
jgi:hypothetical protein